MANGSKIVITAGLQIPETVSTVEKELKVVGEKVSADRALKIVANVDLSKTTQRIQSQLATLSKNLKLDINTVNVNSSGINGVQQNIQQTSTSIDDANKRVQQLENSLANLNKIAPFSPKVDDKGLYDVKATLTSLEKNLSALEGVKSVTTLGRLDDTGKAVQPLREIEATIVSATGEIRKLTFAYNEFKDSFFATKGSVSDSGVVKQIEQIDKFVDTYITKLNSLKAKVGENFAPNISATVGEDLNKTIVTFDSFENKLLELRNGKGTIEEIRAEFVALDGTVKNLGSLLRGGDSSLNQFTNATNNARNFTNELKALEVEYENLSAATRSDSLFNSLADAQQKLVDLQKTQSTEGYTANWIRQYQELSVAIKQATEDLKLAKKLEQQDSSSAAKQQAQAVKDIATAYKEIQQYTKTVYNPNAGRNEVANAESNIAQLRESISLTVQRLETEGLLSDEVIKQIQAYDNLAVETENILNERRVAVEESQKEARAIEEVSKAVKEYGNALEKFNKSKVASNNASNPNVQAQVTTNSELLTQLNTLSSSLADDKSSANIERIRSELNQLVPKLQEAAQASDKLHSSLRNDADARAQQANLDGLINRMNIFASANRKATDSLKQMRSGTTFADEWRRITEALKSGNLDSNQIKQLGMDFRNFRQEADAAGLTTSKFFTNMASQLRMVIQRWVGLYAMINYIRKMVDEVKSLDTAMINLKRVTDETEESYARFLKSATANAAALKTTTSSLVEQSYQWAKLGYSMEEALELANASTIYMRVGDVDQSQALSNLVTSLKAFKLEASDTMGVVDRLDKLNNEFAVSASGLGQGLERSASAMAMTGNSLDQTLALLTGAGEITQNLENTGNALRVVALRLQNMKGKLEELNEPVDDLMEVSKVQTQILNLTGNRVDIFDSATQQFRSTYDILKDISEVWDSLTSVNRASLTEILFGKNRANTGLAIIQAFQSGQIESAFEASMDSMGTAVEENERLMQGLQAQLDALKGSFQNLANATLKSSFLKSIIQGAGGLLDLLTKIVDKVGALPPLLTAIGTFAGLKNVNFVSMFSSIIGGGAMVGVSDAIKSYNQLLATEGKQVAMQKVMNGQFANGNVAFKQYIAGLDGAKASVSGYVTQLGIAKVKTVALQAATVAMNAVMSLGISLAISAAISAITKLIKAEEEQLKKQEDIRQEGQKAVDNYKSEAKEIASLRDEYVKLYSTTDDLSSVQDRLLEIQNKLNKSYSDGKGQVDLLNGSLKENLELLQKQEYDEAKKTQRDLAADYEAVKQDSNFLNWEDYSKLQTVGIDSKTTKAISKKLEQGFIDFFNVNTDYLVHEWKDRNTGETKRRYENALQVDRENGSFFVGGATQEEALENLGRIVDMYKQWEGHDETTLQNLVKINTATQERVKHNKDVLDTIAKTDKIISDYEESLGSDKANRLNEILAEAAEKINKLQEATGYEKFGISQELDKLKSEAQSLAGDNVILADSVKSVFATYTKEISSATGGLEEWRSAWFESLDEVKQGALKNIDSMKSALQNVAGGGLLTWEEFWGLEELDENKILSPVQMIGDKVKVTEEQLITLKDAYIQKQLESLQIEQATREANYQSALKDVQHYTALLREYDEARYGSKNLNNPSYRKYISSQDEINAKIRESQAEVDRLGQEWELTNTVVEAYKSNLGNTVDRQKQLTDLTKKLQDEADNLLKAQEYRIDQIIDKFEDEKEAIEDAKSVLENQLSILEEQESALKDTIENYKSVAELVQETIQDQIDAIKEQNEAREESLDLAQKLANLENARNNKVRVYTEAGGWQYEAKKSDVQKAERELEKAKTDSDIKELEKYLKKWQSLGDKAKKEADERLAVEILGADWREKISVQDEEIFNKYEDEYDAYGAQLWNISNIEIATVKKSIEVKNLEIAAKEAQIKEWQKYKSEVQKAANDAKSANESYMQYLDTVTINENSDLQTRENNLTRFRDTYAGILSELTAKQNELNSAANNYDTSSMLGQVNALADEMAQLEIKWDKVYEMMRNNHYAGSASDAEYYYGYKVGEGYAEGGVSSRTGLAMLHGTKQRSETIFNANDSAKLYDLVHSTPNLVATALTDGVSIARGLTNTSNDSRSVTLNGTTINLPNVQNAEQFARQFESYMQTVLAESQVYKPSR